MGVGIILFEIGIVFIGLCRRNNTGGYKLNLNSACD